MPRFVPRRHPHHSSAWAGSVFFTWRLHRAQGSLSDTERDVVLAIIKRLDGQGSRVHAGVVMDDHVHVLADVGPGRTIRSAVHTWKSISAHQLTRDQGRIAPVWQRDYWDRSIRDSEGFRACVRYILDNPRQRWPSVACYRWVFTQ